MAHQSRDSSWGILKKCGDTTKRVSKGPCEPNIQLTKHKQGKSSWNAWAGLRKKGAKLISPLCYSLFWQ